MLRCIFYHCRPRSKCRRRAGTIVVLISPSSLCLRSCCLLKKKKKQTKRRWQCKIAAATTNFPTGLPFISFSWPTPQRGHHHCQQKKHTKNWFFCKTKKTEDKKNSKGERESANIGVVMMPRWNLPFLFCRRCRHHGGLLRVGNEKMKIGWNARKSDPCTSKKNSGKKWGWRPKIEVGFDR